MSSLPYLDAKSSVRLWDSGRWLGARNFHAIFVRFLATPILPLWASSFMEGTLVLSWVISKGTAKMVPCRSYRCQSKVPSLGDERYWMLTKSASISSTSAYLFTRHIYMWTSLV